MRILNIICCTISIAFLLVAAWNHSCAAEPSPLLSLDVKVEGNYVHFSWSSSIAVDHFIFFYAPFPQMYPIRSVDVGNITDAKIWLPTPSSYYVAIGTYRSDDELILSNTEYFRIREVWRPTPGTSWQWQLSGPIDTSVDATMFDVDLFETSAETIDELHGMGRVVICYFSAGTYEPWRPDAHLFPNEVIGKPLEDWPDERWLDIRRLDLLSGVMESRLDLAVAKGCDGVEPDNIDGYENDTSFSLSYKDQLQYNIWLAKEAHQRGLSIGLKNDLGQVADLVSHYDWALNEECFSFGECELLLPFIQQGKAVFGVEYDLPTYQFCNMANAMRFDFMRKNWELDAWRLQCR